MNIPSKSQYLFLKFTKVGQEFDGRLINKRLGLKKNSLGGLLSGLERSGYIKPLYKEYPLRLITFIRVK